MRPSPPSATSGASIAKPWPPEVQKTFGSAPFQTTRYQEVLARKDIDAVLIATPDFTHPKILADAVQAGKDAYVEKPFATTFEEARMAYDAVKPLGPRRPGRHPAPQRGEIHRRGPGHPEGRHRQGDARLHGVPLLRAALAARLPHGPRRRRRLGGLPLRRPHPGPLRPAQAPRMAAVQRHHQRHPRPLDDPPHRSRRLVSQRPLPPKAYGDGRRLPLEGRPPDQRRLPGDARIRRTASSPSP